MLNLCCESAVVQAVREPLHVLEGRRQQQLLELQSLVPEHPTQLLADYRAAALKFEMYQVPPGWTVLEQLLLASCCYSVVLFCGLNSSLIIHPHS